MNNLKAFVDSVIAISEGKPTNRMEADILLDMAIASVKPNDPAEFIVKNGDEYVKGRSGDGNYCTPDISKAKLMPEAVADALVAYLGFACDCGHPSCEYPTVLPSSKLVAPSVVKH